ncbi:MAG: DUF72 domain-containing protein [Actinobacteria bacterium]|nr:DUF72 domain-containing protein [Actinomycetota bacterium]
MARVGCSGWAYRDWRGLFYPESLPTSAWFEFYARHFDTVEINNSFYRLPTAEAAESWERQAPPGFVYALKLGQFGSHRKKLKDPTTGWLDNHLDRVRRLGSHLGPNLVQLPPRWKRDVARLDDFLAAAPTDIRWAVEMRDTSWLHDDVFHVLERHGAALCIHDLLAGHPWIRTTDWTYIRFHGPNAIEQPYHGRYGPQRLGRSAERLTEWLQDGYDAYAYFNNDYEGHAIQDALWLREQLAPFEAVA